MRVNPKQGIRVYGYQNFDLVWQKLPDDVVEKTLLCLPQEYICRYRAVCKEWSALLSSARFLNLWNGMLQNRHSWLLFLNNKSSILYYFSSGAWRKISTSLKSTRTAYYSSNCEGAFRKISTSFESKRTAYYNDCKGSSTGLLLLDSKTFLYVCNPLTRTLVQLPRLVSIKKARIKGIIGGSTADGKECYTVVASNCNSENIEMYNSLEKEWKIVAQLNRHCYDMTLSYEDDGCFFYCLIYMPPPGMMIYSFQSCNTVPVEAFVPLPTNDTSISFEDQLLLLLPIRARLVLCNSSLLLITAVLWVGSLFKDIIVWKFEKNDVNLSSSSWQEIARMPPSVCAVFNKSSQGRAECSRYYDCVGIGECIYFNRGGSREVIAFNLMHGLWIFLPTCPTDVYPANTHSCKMISFQPWLSNEFSSVHKTTQSVGPSKAVQEMVE